MLTLKKPKDRLRWLFFAALFLAVFLPNVGEAASVTFKDLARYQWEDGKKAIQVMSQSRIINGYPDGTFRPAEPITRQQAAKIIAMSLGLQPAPASFTDVPKGPSYIGALQQAGVVSGDQQGRYRPGDHLTRAQLAKMIVLGYGLQMKQEPKLKDVKNDDLGKYVRIAASNGVMTGYEDGTFRPNQPVKRDQAAVMIHRAMRLVGDDRPLPNEPGDSPDAGKPDDDKDSGEQPGSGNEPGSGDDSGEGEVPPPGDNTGGKLFRLFVDAGHGGEDPGAMGKLADGSQIREKEINLDIANEIARIFRTEYVGVEVAMSRSDDTFVMLSERTRQANEWGADYFVSIHVNSAASPSASGFETYIYNGPVSAETVEKQRIIHQVIVDKLGLKDRGMKRANFAVLRESKMPAILIENLFISNPADAALLSDPQFRKQLARAIVEGIAKAWNLQKKKTSAEFSNDNMNNQHLPESEQSQPVNDATESSVDDAA
jgi:N-acetylmuramoyl-L-alanine amidase